MSDIISTNFLAPIAQRCGDTARIVLVAKSGGNKGSVSIAERQLTAPKNGYLLSDRSRSAPKILDSCSGSFDSSVE